MKLNIKYENNSKITDEEIWELCKSVGWDNNCYPFSKTKSKSYAYFTVRIKNKLIGFLDVVSDGFNDAYIWDFVIHKNYQDQGIGSELMKYALNYLKEKQIRCIQVTFEQKLI